MAKPRAMLLTNCHVDHYDPNNGSRMILFVPSTAMPENPITFHAHSSTGKVVGAVRYFRTNGIVFRSTQDIVTGKTEVSRWIDGSWIDMPKKSC